MVCLSGNLQKWRSQLEKLKWEVDWAIEIVNEGLFFFWVGRV